MPIPDPVIVRLTDAVVTVFVFQITLPVLKAKVIAALVLPSRPPALTAIRPEFPPLCIRRHWTALSDVHTLASHPDETTPSNPEPP